MTAMSMLTTASSAVNSAEFEKIATYLVKTMLLFYLPNLKRL